MKSLAIWLEVLYNLFWFIRYTCHTNCGKIFVFSSGKNRQAIIIKDLLKFWSTRDWSLMFHYFCYIQQHLNKPIIGNCLRVFLICIASIDTYKTVLRFILPENVYTYWSCKLIYLKEFKSLRFSLFCFWFQMPWQITLIFYTWFLRTTNWLM